MLCAAAYGVEEWIGTDSMPDPVEGESGYSHVALISSSK